VCLFVFSLIVFLYVALREKTCGETLIPFLFLSMLIYGVSYQQCLLNKRQEESSETGINRRYKNSCLPLKKDSRIFKPHRTVLINNKATKQHYLFFYYIYGLLPSRGWPHRKWMDCPGRRDCSTWRKSCTRPPRPECTWPSRSRPFGSRFGSWCSAVDPRLWRPACRWGLGNQFWSWPSGLLGRGSGLRRERSVVWCRLSLAWMEILVCGRQQPACQRDGRLARWEQFGFSCSSSLRTWLVRTPRLALLFSRQIRHCSLSTD